MDRVPETQQKQPVTNKKGHRLHEAQPCQGLGPECNQWHARFQLSQVREVCLFALAAFLVRRITFFSHPLLA